MSNDKDKHQEYLQDTPGFVMQGPRVKPMKTECGPEDIADARKVLGRAEGVEIPPKCLEVGKLVEERQKEMQAREYNEKEWRESKKTGVPTVTVTNTPDNDDPAEY